MTRAHHDELRDELIAILGAGRELPPDADRQLADAFVTYLERQTAPNTLIASPRETETHQPHYSLVLAGAAWGAAVMLLLVAWSQTSPTDQGGAGTMLDIVATLLILAFAAALARAILFLARHGWHISRMRITISSSEERRH